MPVQMSIIISDTAFEGIKTVAEAKKMNVQNVIENSVETVFTEIRGEEKRVTKTMVFITTSFPAYHKWTDAPEKHNFLRCYHRHTFYVEMSWEVSHNDREIEFIEMKNKVDVYINKHFKNKYIEHSCEDLSNILQIEFDCYSVEVSEDGENGAVVVNEHE